MTSLSKIVLVLLSASLMTALTVSGQQGQFLSLSGLGQYTKLNNRNDFATRTRAIIPRDVYHPGAGLRYTNNFDPNFGFETGVLYTLVGQRYKGEVDSSFTGMDVTEYDSEVTMQYLKVPVLFRFNSTLDADETAYLSIGIGFAVDVLLDVKAETSPQPNIPAGLSIDYRDLYKNVTSSFLADAVFNFKLGEGWFLKTGINVNFGISDIEEKGYELPENAPSTWHFPVSTYKESQPDMEARDRTRHSIFGVEIGVAYQIGEGE